MTGALSALSYAELSAALPRIGSEYLYLRKAFPNLEWLSFTTGFIVTLAGIATAATVALAFAGYSAQFLPMPAWSAALGLLGACTCLNIAGIRQATWINIVFTSIEALGLVMVIAAGLMAVGGEGGGQGGGGVEGGRGGEVAEGEGGALPSAGVLAAASLIFFVYTGFEGLVNLAEECKRPERDLPRAILLSLGVTTVLYTLVAVAVVALAEPEELADSKSPLALAAGKASSKLAGAISWIAMCAMANTALITSLTVSRLLLGMARDGMLPRALAVTAAKRKTPWVAALVIFAAAAAMLPLGSVELVASVSSLATLLAFVTVNVALIVIRRKEPDLLRPFRVPLAVRGVPIPSVLAIVAACMLGMRFSTATYLVAGCTVVAGLGLYGILRRRPRGFRRLQGEAP